MKHKLARILRNFITENGPKIAQKIEKYAI